MYSVLLVRRDGCRGLVEASSALLTSSRKPLAGANSRFMRAPMYYSYLTLSSDPSRKTTWPRTRSRGAGGRRWPETTEGHEAWQLSRVGEVFFAALCHPSLRSVTPRGRTPS